MSPYIKELSREDPPQDQPTWYEAFPVRQSWQRLEWYKMQGPKMQDIKNVVGEDKFQSNNGGQIFSLGFVWDAQTTMDDWEALLRKPRSSKTLAPSKTLQFQVS